MQRLADATDLGVRPGRAGARDAHTLRHQRSGENCRQIVTSRPRGRRVRRPRALANRYRLAGQQRLVDGYVRAFQQHPVGGNAIAFANLEHVAHDDVASGDPLPFAVPQHQCARARKLAESLERSFALALLVEGDSDDHDDGCGKDEGLPVVAEDDIDHRGRDQHQEHRLAGYVPRNRGEIARAR